MLSLRAPRFATTSGLLRAVTLRMTLGLAFVSALVAVSRPAQAAPIDKREVEAREDFAGRALSKGGRSLCARCSPNRCTPTTCATSGAATRTWGSPLAAIDSFQDYLHKAKDLSPPEHQEIEGYIKDMEALRASEAPPTPPAPAIAPPAPSPPLPSPGAPPPANGTGAPPATMMPPFEPLAPPPPGALGAAPSPASDGRSFRVAGIATAAGGVALIAVGIGFGAAAQSAADEVAKKYNSSTDSAGKRDATLQWVGYGIGAAAVATGVLLYVHGRQPDGEHASDHSHGLHGVAWLDGHAGAVLLEGAF